MTALQSYKGFAGGLYENSSNSAPGDHDAEGRRRAGLIQPLDAGGNPSASGKIVVIGIGMSNWTDELCHAQSQVLPCDSFTFQGQAAITAGVNRANLVLLDCAISGQTAIDWIDNSAGNYSACLNDVLAPAGVTQAQVQVILWKDADAHPSPSSAITSAQGQTPSVYCAANPTVDACNYLRVVGQMTRFTRGRYPNLRQLFVHSRIYAGYASSDLNPEPFAYEYGFATKWLVQAQINQMRGNGIDPSAGDLDYTTGAAPWIAWGPYFWASGSIPRSDGLVWVPSDFDSSDFTHPSAGNGGGRMKVAGMMINFYLASPYTPWFRP